MDAKASAPSSRTWVKLVGLILAALAAWFGKDLAEQGDSTESAPKTAPAKAGLSGKVDSAALIAAARAQRSGVWVKGEGRVIKLLADDLEGIPHQRFLITVDGLENQTIKVSNNLDLGTRVPVEKGDLVQFEGEFEWNEGLGGAVHWTHDDPAGKHQAGWIKLDGVLYQ
jgi:hypothetical protein